MIDFIKSIPITPDIVSLWVPGGANRAQDLIRGNHGEVIGAHSKVPTIAPPIEQINACDATTGWLTGTGGSLSIDTSDKKEGTGSLKDTIASPEINVYYNTFYNPTGTWDWSDKEYLLLWFYCDRASTAFGIRIIQIIDSLNNNRTYTIAFSAGEWTAIKIPLHSGWTTQTSTPPNMALVNKIYIQLKAADTTAFYKKFDDLRVTGKPSLINPSVGWGTDGVDDKVDCGNDKSLDFTDELTIGAFIKTTSAALGEPIVKGHFKYLFYYRGTMATKPLEFVLVLASAGWTGCGDWTLPCGDGKWHFVIGTFNGTQLKYYQDTVLINTVTVAADTISTDTNPLAIGSRFNGTNPFGGYVVLPFVAKGVWSQAKVTNFGLAIKGLFSPRGF